MLQAISDRLTRSATIALLLSPAGLLLLAAARLLIISDYNTATASAIVSSSGYLNTLLGTLIPLIPLIMPYLALILLFFNRVIPGILALVATAFISPVAAASRPAIAGLAVKDWHQIINSHTNAVIGLLAVVVAFLLLIELAGVGFNACMRTIATIACIALIPTIARLYPLPFNNDFYTQLVRQPWLPAETFTLSSGQKMVGYSLSDDGTWTEILLDDTRTIHFYPASDVGGRQICQIGQVQPMQPLITLASGGTRVSPRTPSCQASPVAPSSPAPPSKPVLPIRGPRP